MTFTEIQELIFSTSHTEIHRVIGRGFEWCEEVQFASHVNSKEWDNCRMIIHYLTGVKAGYLAALKNTWSDPRWGSMPWPQGKV